jgi:uncharacterized repeat protein (TIGR01451 family)
MSQQIERAIACLQEALATQTVTLSQDALEAIAQAIQAEPQAFMGEEQCLQLADGTFAEGYPWAVFDGTTITARGFLSARDMTQLTGASATDPCNCPCLVCPDPEAPTITALKTVTSTGPYTTGSSISGTVAVTNTGNVDLSNVTVQDTNPGTVVSGSPIATLAQGQTVTLAWVHTVTADEATAGTHTNTPAIIAQTTAGTPAVVTANTVTTPVQAAPPTYFQRKPSTGGVVQQHACENVCGNPARLALMDHLYMMEDTDGSISLYNSLTRTQVADYTWTTFSGGVFDGMTLAQAKASGMWSDAENGYITAIAPNGQMQLYPASTGTYYTTWGPAGGFVGGPLAGHTQPQTPPAGWTYLGMTDSNYYYLSPTGSLVMYYHANKIHNTLGTATTLSGGGAFNGPLANAINNPPAGGCFVSATSEELFFIAPNGNYQRYAYTGAFLGEAAGQPLLPACECWTCNNGTCTNSATGATMTEAAFQTSGVINQITGPC